jgi:thiamine pyrophosphokinase
MTALILCNGAAPSAELLAHHLREADLIICTDGAAGWAQEAGVHPQVIIGDMDSSEAPAAGEVVDCGPHDQQHNTDAEKALLLALARGAERVVLLGATGQRLDHTLANVWLVARYHRQADLVLADDWGELRVASGRFVMPAQPGQLVSLMALTPDVVLDTEGLKWPLHEPLELGTRGLSNEATADEIVVDVRSGWVAVVVPRER